VFWVGTTQDSVAIPVLTAAAVTGVEDAGWVVAAAAVELPLTGELWPQAANQDAVMINAAHRAAVASCLISSIPN